MLLISIVAALLLVLVIVGVAVGIAVIVVVVSVVESTEIVVVLSVTVGNCTVKDEDGDNEDGIEVAEITDEDEIGIDADNVEGTDDNVEGKDDNVEGMDDNVNSETVTDDEGDTDPLLDGAIK